MVLLLYVALKTSGAAEGSKAIFGYREALPVFAISDAASNESRLAGLVHGNPWKHRVGNRRGVSGVLPKVLYVSVKDKANVQWDVQSSINQCASLNPGYTVEIMGDAQRNSTVQQYAPSLLPVYNNLKPTERNDFWSYLMLYLFGGWYIDHDVHCYKPFDEWTAEFNGTANAVVGVEVVIPEGNRNAIGFCCPVQYVHWVMGSAPGHILYSHVVDLMLDLQATAAADPNSAPGQQIDNPVMTTGPGMLTKAVEHFLALYDAYSLDIAIEDPTMVADLLVLPRTAVSVGGYGTASADASQIYVKHMFAGTWKHGASGTW